MFGLTLAWDLESARHAFSAGGLPGDRITQRNVEVEEILSAYCLVAAIPSREGERRHRNCPQYRVQY